MDSRFIRSRYVQMIVGHEPRREGEYPTVLSVKHDKDIRDIQEEEYDCGTYVETWFVVYDHSGRVVRKMNASAVAEVHYV